MAQQLAIVRFMTKTKFHVVKGIDHNFDLMELCFVIKLNNYFSLLFQEITFITDSQVATKLLPTFLTGGKLDFQVANLLLATTNLEPWLTILI